MKNSLKKLAFSTLILTLLSIFSSNTLLAQNQNFSGTWTRDTKKTDPGDLSINSVPVQVDVKQGSRGISIKRTSRNKENDTTRYAEELKYDGTIASSVVKKNLNKKSSIKWSDDKTSFTESADYTDDQGNPVQKVTEIWALKDGGKTLEVAVTFDINGDTTQMKEVFDKQ